MAKRGRPKSEFNQAVDAAPSELLRTLEELASQVNAEVIEPADVRAATNAKLRGEIARAFQPIASRAGAVEQMVRAGTRESVAKALNSPRLAAMSDLSAAVNIATQLGLSPHTVRKHIAAIKKLTGPA